MRYGLFCRCFTLFLCAAFTLAAHAQIRIFPQEALNPRVPVIAPVPDAQVGFAAPFDTTFRYAIEPLIGFPSGGNLSVMVRDDFKRNEKIIFTLTDGNQSLSLRIAPAAKNRKFECVISDGPTSSNVVALENPGEKWSRIQIQWNAQTCSVTQNEKLAGNFALKKTFTPRSLAMHTWHIADVSLAGDGELKLNWAEGYAAHVTPAKNCDAVSLRALGMDTGVISLNPTARDCPMLQICNASDHEQTVVIECELLGERSASTQHWQQSIKIPGKKRQISPITFPSPMQTDLYHLSISSEKPALRERWHFIFVQRRSEQAGPAKFGIHDSGAKQFGLWPDALPIDIAHTYASWAYIQGPPWTKDFDGQWGTDPNLPPEQWNWTPRADWFALEGKKLYLCVQSVPFLDWQRSKMYPESKMKKYAWGWRGGAPEDAGYRRFLQALAARYRTKVWAYEIENEPNTPQGFEPVDYAAIAKAVYEEMKSADPNARVFGICGTSTFTDWMQKVFNAGAGKYMDGVSWHTYVTPSMPEEANLGYLLTKAKQVIAAANPALTMLNSETGTYVAPREEVDHAMNDERLAQLINEGVRPLVVPTGWPSHAISERAGGISVVTNAVTNFLSGAECFVFFGWNPLWPKEPKWWNVPFDDTNFSLFSCSKTGERTPSRYMLAAAVMTAQMEPALVRDTKTIHEGRLRGGLFSKASGGQLAVLWSVIGKQTVLVQSTQRDLEIVRMEGLVTTSKGVATDEKNWLHSIDVSEEPIYIHQSTQGMIVLPPPVRVDVVSGSSPEKSRIVVSAQNAFNTTWTGGFKVLSDSKWVCEPGECAFNIEAGKQEKFLFDLTMKSDTPRGQYPVTVIYWFPDRRPGSASAMLKKSPSFQIVKLPAGVNASQLNTWEMPGGSMLLDRAEQVVVGRPPALASLQDPAYWGGPQELSGKVKVASDEENLLIYIEAQDANCKLPTSWPGVGGTCVEIFLDARFNGQGLGLSQYNADVYQLVIRPVLDAVQEPAIWKASAGSKNLPGVRVVGGTLGKGRFWLTVQVPWKDLGVTPNSGRAIGLDVGLNGAQPAGGRKSQIMLFGIAANNQDASHFGLGYSVNAKDANAK